MSLQPKELTPDGILQLGFASWGSKTLLSAIELGLFTELAQTPLDTDTLAERLNLHPRSARDSGISLGSAQAIAQQFPWQDHQTFVDVGADFNSLESFDTQS